MKKRPEFHQRNFRPFEIQDEILFPIVKRGLTITDQCLIDEIVSPSFVQFLQRFSSY